MANLVGLFAPHFSTLVFRLIIIALGLASARGLEASTTFDIPAQPIPEALRSFTKQSGKQVLYEANLTDIKANAVSGDMEPLEALTRLLAGTGYRPSQKGANFVIAREPGARTGRIEGSVREEKTGKPVAEARVGVLGTTLSGLTDSRGSFSIDQVPAGILTLGISAEGMQNTRVTDVAVKEGRTYTLGAVTLPLKVPGVVQLEDYIVSAKKNDGVIELDAYSVEGRRVKPFVGGNMDIPRTINDVQPYYIFDSDTIDQSGAINVEDFLKQRLTMNATARSNGQQTPNTAGNTSSINLRGLGADKTLILINGRRAAGFTLLGNSFQADLNGLSLSSIERIEVLPAAASGIYGGSALGGVVNIITKRNYAGGEIRMTYDNTFDSDTARRSVSASYGFPLEGGKTHLLLTAAWTDSSRFLLQDRRAAFQQNVNTLLANYPDQLGSFFNPPVGTVTNISSELTPTLTLKNGVVLPSDRTFLAPGTAPTTSTGALYASLAANAGKWNYELPASTQSPSGLLQQLLPKIGTRSFSASLRRQTGSKVELFADFSYADNRTSGIYNINLIAYSIPASSPINPFNQTVYVRAPDRVDAEQTTRMLSRNLTLGAVVQLPRNWTGEFDYTWSTSRYRYVAPSLDLVGRLADEASGVVNPFLDPFLYPVDNAKYSALQRANSSSDLDDFALRGSGPLWSLPWGTPSLTLGAGHRIARALPGTVTTTYLNRPSGNSIQAYLVRRQVTDSGYAEVKLPLIKQGWLPLVHALELQASGRSERYTVDTGTTVANINPLTGATTYSGPTISGQPYFSEAKYVSTNGTVGIKYQPVEEITIRASVASAFLPPTPTQLVRNPVPSATLTNVLDPRTGTTVGVQILSGGNPDLKPQNAQSFNGGIIWEPRLPALKGLRLNAEYYRVRQDDFIATLTPQQIVNLESTYQDRVTRSAAGAITRVDASALNLYQRETTGWDVSADYSRKTLVGKFGFSYAESIIVHLKSQYSLTLPSYEAAGYSPNESGAPKHKRNGTLTWEYRSWTVSWAARYFDSYKQYGAAGGPASRQSSNGGVNGSYVRAQGRESIASQIYHDVFVSHDFDPRKMESGPRVALSRSKLLSGLSVQVGVRNVFDKVPPYDAYSSAVYFFSPYGDLRLRSTWVSVKKAF
ncbi:MAG: TonB-dependent receptor [Opitutaceae bacterium]|nr:TonB-dependent receptor [Opitutaceae bacterium]